MSLVSSSAPSAEANFKSPSVVLRLAIVKVSVEGLNLNVLSPSTLSAFPAAPSANNTNILSEAAELFATIT